MNTFLQNTCGGCFYDELSYPRKFIKLSFNFLMNLEIKIPKPFKKKPPKEVTLSFTSTLLMLYWLKKLPSRQFSYE